MRSINRSPSPNILTINHSRWTADFIADPKNKTKRYRYRHPDIKITINNDCTTKCVYCESVVGDNCPGDIEHYVPTSIDKSKQFEWENLLLACTECNRRKGTYFDAATPFLDPYNDDVESRVIHAGPIVTWKPGDESAEISVRTLELHDESRDILIQQKILKLNEVSDLIERIVTTRNAALKALLVKQLEKMKSHSGEYSGMVTELAERLGF